MTHAAPSRWRALAQEELRAFALAVQFLTRLPAPAEEAYSPERLAASVRHYPLVGALVGAFCAGIFWLADFALPGSVALLLAVAAGLALTGAMHEDGLADTFDGIGAGANQGGGQGTDEEVGNRSDLQRSRVLEVMRDSRLGALGATALVMALAIKVTTLASLPPLAVCVALIVGHGLSRLSCIVLMQTSTYVRKAGIATPMAGRFGRLSWLTVLATAAVLVGGLVLLLGPLTASLALAGLIAGHTLMRLAFERQLGGYTGDTLGAVQQASEIGLYLGVSASAGAWTSF